MITPDACPFASEEELHAALAEVCTPRIIARLVLEPTQEMAAYENHAHREHGGIKFGGLAQFRAFLALEVALGLPARCTCTGETRWLITFSNLARTFSLGRYEDNALCDERFEGVPAPPWFPRMVENWKRFEDWCQGILTAQASVQALQQGRDEWAIR